MKKYAESRHGYPADPLIDEVRAIRAKIWRSYGNDLERGIADLRKLEKRPGVKLVRLAPKRVPRKRKAS